MNILVSACLLGERCRYDGRSKRDAAVERGLAGHVAVSVCPEMAAGLPCPRTPCEAQAGGKRVFDSEGRDMTDAFAHGAACAVRIAESHECRLAVLKSKSPSCGSGLVYDGSFSGRLVSGDGFAARALKSRGVAVVDEVAFAADPAGVLRRIEHGA